MAEIASAFVSLIPSARGFGSKLNSQIGPEVDGAGKSAGSRFGKVFAAAGGALAAAGIGSFLKGSVDAASDMMESASKVGVVFGKSADQIMKTAKTSATAMGLSKVAYLGATGSLGNLLVSLDLAPKKAANMSQEMVKLAGDMASFNNVSPEDALAALQSGLTGETEPLKRFGVNMNDATLKAQAMKMGLIATTKEALTPQAKALSAQALIMDQTKTAQGDFARTSGGLANQQRILAAQFDNVKAKVGSALLPVITNFVSLLNGRVIPGVRGFIAEVRNGSGVGGRFAATFRAITAVLGTVATFILKNKAAVGTFAGIIGTAIVVTKAWRVAQLALNAAMRANPIGLVITAVALLAAGLVMAYKRSQTFRAVVDGAFSAVKAGAQSLANFVTKTIPAAFDTVVNAVQSIPGKITAVFSGASTLLYNAGVQLISGLASGIAAKINDAIDAVQSGLSRIKGLLPGSPIKWGPLKSWNNGGAGKRLMETVAKGIEKGTPKTVKAAQEAFGKIGDALKKERDGLQSTLNGLKGDFKSLADSVKGAFTGDLFGVSATEAMAPANIWAPAAGTAAKSVGQNFIDNLMQKRGELRGLLASFTTLKGWGLDPAFLSQLFASGNGALITEMAGMGKAGALGAANLFGEVNALGAQLGNAVAQNDPVATRIDETNRLLTKVIRQNEHLGDDIGKALNKVARQSAQKKDKKGGKP